MEPQSEVEKLFLEAAERIRQEGYDAGWRAAIAAAVKALEELTGEPDWDAMVSSAARVVPPTSGNVTVGSTPWYVLQTITKRPGMSGSEIVTAVQEGGHKVSDGSIRTSIARLRNRKLIVGRHGKWFPA